MTEETKTFERNLKGQDYRVIDAALSKCSNQVLIDMLDSKSIKIGDTAVTHLMRKNAFPEIIDAVLGARVSTRLGKIRSINALFTAGRKFPDALRAHLFLLKDKSDEISSCVLLSLVFWGDKNVIPLIKERRTLVKTPERTERFLRACEAIEGSDPTIFDPYFSDVSKVWD